MFSLIKIWWLKRRLKKFIIKFQEDYVFYQCGIETLNHITGNRYSRDKERINHLKQILKDIDPKYPKDK